MITATSDYLSRAEMIDAGIRHCEEEAKRIADMLEF
jgi:hypothetical protein